LFYIYDKKVIFLYKYDLLPNLGTRELNSPEKVSKGIDYLLDNGHNVYIISSNIYMDNILYFLDGNQTIDFIGTHEFSYRYLLPSFNELPNIKQDAYLMSNIYKVTRGKTNLINPTNASIDIGSPLDFRYIVSGFHDREKSGNITSRWTSGNADVRVPTPENRDLLIYISTGGLRPKNTPPALVNLYLNEHLIGNFTTQGEYKTYKIIANKEYLISPYSILRINSTTWKPSEYIGTSDTRDLGIKIDEISIEQSG
jgi:hypothetical protein